VSDVETRLLVETLAFKVEVVLEALVDTLPQTPADAKTTTF